MATAITSEMRARVHAIPNTRAGALAERRVLKQFPTMADFVEPIVLALVEENETFREALGSYDAGSSHYGNRNFDRVNVIGMIITYARDHGLRPIGFDLDNDKTIYPAVSRSLGRMCASNGRYPTFSARLRRQIVLGLIAAE